MEKKRLGWIDLARFLAICCVILCHVTESVFDLDIDCMGYCNRFSAAFAFAAFTLGRMGVPLFLMISGYLLLGREYDDTSVRRFYKNSVFHLLVCAWIWFLFYDVLLVITGRQTFNLRNIIMDLLLLRSVGFTHVWYLPMIIGMYILVPFVSNGVKNLSVKAFSVPLAVYCYLCFICPLLHHINTAFALDFPIYVMVPEGFSGGVYGFYIILGLLVKKGLLKKVKTLWAAVLAVVFFVLAVLQMSFSYKVGYKWNMWYDCLFLMVFSAFVFELLSRIRTLPLENSFRFLSVYSFAVYLIHNVVLVYTLQLITSTDIILPLQVVILEVFLLAASYLLAFLISRIPKVGKYILYIK